MLHGTCHTFPNKEAAFETVRNILFNGGTFDVFLLRWDGGSKDYYDFGRKKWGKARKGEEAVGYISPLSIPMTNITMNIHAYPIVGLKSSKHVPLLVE